MFFIRISRVKLKLFLSVIVMLSFIFTPARGRAAELIVNKTDGTVIEMPDYESEDVIKITGSRLTEEDWAELRGKWTVPFHLILDNGQDAIPALALSSSGMVPSAVITVSAPDVINIGDDAFSNNSYLVSADFPSLKSIGEMAFFSCSSLREIELPKSIESLKDGAFAMCRALESIKAADGNEHFKSVDGILYSKDGNTLYAYPAGKTEREFVSDAADIRPFSFYGAANIERISFSAAAAIGNGTFVSCLKLADINLPEGLKFIGNGAFDSCQSLETVKLPASLEVIGDGAFSYCGKLNSISLAEGNEHYKSVDGVLYSRDENILCAYPAGSDRAFFFSGVREVRPYAFMFAIKLKMVTLPNAAVVGEGAFAWCESLTAAYLPSARAFGDGAFAWCVSLDLMLLGDSAPAIGEKTFTSDELLLLILSVLPEAQLNLEGWPAGAKLAKLRGPAALGPAALKLRERLTLSLDIEGASDYQWKKDGKPVDGDRGAVFNRAEAVEEDSGLYGVTFKYDMGSGPVDIEIEGIPVIVLP